MAACQTLSNVVEQKHTHTLTLSVAISAVRRSRVENLLYVYVCVCVRGNNIEYVARLLYRQIRATKPADVQYNFATFYASVYKGHLFRTIRSAHYNPTVPSCYLPTVSSARPPRQFPRKSSGPSGC